MSVNRNGFRHLLGALLALFAFAAMAAAQSPQQADFSNVKIKNFGQMDERFYRGAQPKKEDYESLKALGITTVIDLQAEPKDYEKQMVESLGMHYVNIPMIDKAYPKAEDVTTFLKVVNDPATGKFYVHCAGGRHRTGAMGAVYRFTKYHWNYDQVYSEMKKFDFYTSWGHGDFKKFVEDYWAQMQANTTATVSAAGK
ncbi:MAG: tyrosine-protein phosphatase [Acidobacteriota bacterium]|jgi:protein tyrosine/serine phosphatase|nr:tyrosine-protein phosphatase [Acidobacteriota bacterium]